MRDFYLGAHAPDLTDEEINFIHKLWLDASHESGLENIRHRHIVTAALVRLADELHGDRRRQVLDFLRTLKKGESIKGQSNSPATQEKSLPSQEKDRSPEVSQNDRQ